ncbi:radical SAM protein [Thomasclavelia sp.]
MKIPEIKAKTIVQNKADKNHFWFGFDYNMNLYQGCHHGCIYCDSRSECYHVENFDQVKVKQDVTALLSKELCAKKRKGVIAIGAMSDPYNHYEQQLKITHQALKIISQTGFGVMITTKSHTIINDLEILKNINARQSVLVCMTITCGNDQLSKKIEQNVSLSSKRFETIKQLRQQNIYAGVLMTPILPFINDTPENIKEIVYQAHLANASFIYPMFGVTLRDRQREYFYDQLDQLFPGLKDIYIKQFGNNYLCNSPRIYELKKLFIEECHNYNLTYKMEDIIKGYKQTTLPPKQLSLF